MESHVGNSPHRWLQVLLASFAVGVLGGGIYVVTKSWIPFCVLVALSSIGVALAFGLHLDLRLRFHAVIDLRTVALVFLAGGVVGQAIAELERLLPHVTKTHWIPILLVGPIEETAKLAVPLALFFWGSKRFRDPRVGLAAVLASAAAFGVAETALYAYRAVHDEKSLAVIVGIGVFKPLVDPLIHMCITGIFGAIAWRTWHRRGHFVVTWGVLGSLLLAMGLHDLNDILVIVAGRAGLVAEAGLLVLVYMIFKFAARGDIPEDAVESVPHWWRPTHALAEAAATEA